MSRDRRPTRPGEGRGSRLGGGKDRYMPYKEKTIAYVLWFFGLHRFYFDKIPSAIVMVILWMSIFGIGLTAIPWLIWWVIDGIHLGDWIEDWNDEADEVNDEIDKEKATNS